MKKALSIILVLAMMLSTFALLPVSAEEAAAKPSAESLKGQQVNYVWYDETKIPTIDGAVGADEYAGVLELKAADVKATEKTAGVAPFGYIKVYFSWNEENLYVAVVAQEDVFQESINSGTKYNQIALRLGFNSGVDSVAAGHKTETTFRIDTDRFFAGTGDISYSATGAESKPWKILNKVHGGEKGNSTEINKDTAKCRYYTRGKDADGKDITTYEIVYTKSVLKEFYGEAVDFSRAYISMWANNTNGTWEYCVNDQETKDAFTAAYGWSPKYFGHILNFADKPNTYEVPQIGQQTIEVNGKTTTAPKADGVVNANEYTSLTTFTAESAGIDQKFEGTFDKNDIGYVKLGVSYDDDAVYFALVVQQDNFKYGADGASLQVLADDEGSSMSAAKQFETTLRINGTADAPKFFAGTSAITYKADGTQDVKSWDYLNSKINLPVHGENNETTPANATTKYFTRTVDADGKAITVYELKYTMAAMKHFFGEDNDFSRIAIRLNVWAYNEAGAKTGRWTYWNAPDAELSAQLKAAYGFAPSTIGNVIEFKDTTPDTSDNSVKYVVLGTFALVAVVALGTTVVYKKRRQLSK